MRSCYHTVSRFQAKHGFNSVCRTDLTTDCSLTDGFRVHDKCLIVPVIGCYNTAYSLWSWGRLSWAHHWDRASEWQFPQSVPLTSASQGQGLVSLGHRSSLTGQLLTTPTTSLARETTNQGEGGSGDVTLAIFVLSTGIMSRSSQ